MKYNRSNSSLPLRNHLKKNFVTIPDITEKVSLSSYIRLARNLYHGGLTAQQHGDFRRAYIDLYKFQKLTLEKIPTHRDFLSNSVKLYDDRKWLDEFQLMAMKNLEQVVDELDREEDIRLAHIRELEMIDEFEHQLDDIKLNDKDHISDNHNKIESKFTYINKSTERESIPQCNIRNIDPCETIQSDSLLNVALYSNNTDNREISFDISNRAKSKDISRLSILKLSENNVRFEENDLYQCRNLDEVSISQTPTNKDPGKNSIHTNFNYDSGCLGKIEASMLRCIGVYSRFISPQPSVANINVIIGLNHYYFYQDDYHTSYASFLTEQPIDVQLSKPAVEMNRCFFIHIGIATIIHPFALQCAFRILSFNIMKNVEKDDFSKDILSSVLEYCGLVDANALCFLWPVEYNDYRISFISGSLEHPIISIFQSLSIQSTRPLKDVIIRCSGDHFTILRPTNFSFDQLLSHAKQAKLVVQINEVNPNCSIQYILSNFSKQ